jgi:spermidine synthase
MPDSNLEFLGYEETSIGTLSLRRRSLLSRPGTVVTEILLDHELLMTSYITDSERALSRVAREMHAGSELRVMVGGLGLGYTAWEIAQAPGVERIEVVEFVPAVIEWMRAGLMPLSSQLNSDSRVSFVSGDVFERLSLPPNADEDPFDLILIDVDHSPAEQLDDANPNEFYTAHGLRAAQRLLAPEGILGVWSYAQSSPFADALHETFEEVRVEAVTFFNDLVDAETTDWIFFARTPKAD